MSALLRLTISETGDIAIITTGKAGKVGKKGKTGEFGKTLKKVLFQLQITCELKMLHNRVSNVSVIVTGDISPKWKISWAYMASYKSALKIHLGSL